MFKFEQIIKFRITNELIKILISQNMITFCIILLMKTIQTFKPKSKDKVMNIFINCQIFYL